MRSSLPHKPGGSLWFTPLVLSLVFHIVMPAVLFMGQYFFKPSRITPEVYTVTLLNVGEASMPAPPPPPPPPAAAGPTETAPQAEPSKTEQPEPTSAEPPRTEPVKDAKPPVSLKPKEIEPEKEKKKKIDPDAYLKKKMESLLKKTRADQKAEEAEKKKELETQKEAERLEKDAKEKADRAKEAADKAVAALRSRYKRGAAATKDASQEGIEGGVAGGQKGGVVGGQKGGIVGGQKGGSGGGGGDANKAYYAAVAVRIQENWILPDLQSWQANLEAIVCLKVQRDGKVIDIVVEKKSANAYFDQFVMKAIHDASPLPPFPEEIQETELEICPKFYPAGLL